MSARTQAPRTQHAASATRVAATGVSAAARRRFTNAIARPLGGGGCARQCRATPRQTQPAAATKTQRAFAHRAHLVSRITSTSSGARTHAPSTAALRSGVSADDGAAAPAAPRPHPPSAIAIWPKIPSAEAAAPSLSDPCATAIATKKIGIVKKLHARAQPWLSLCALRKHTKYSPPLTTSPPACAGARAHSLNITTPSVVVENGPAASVSTYTCAREYAKGCAFPKPPNTGRAFPTQYHGANNAQRSALPSQRAVQRAPPHRHERRR